MNIFSIALSIEILFFFIFKLSESESNLFFLIQIFFDAKVEEIVNIFTEGPKVDFKKTEVVLKKIAPFFGARWKQIKA